MHIHDFHYELPPLLIARYPLPERSGSRLLCLNKDGVRHRHFKDILELLQPKDLLLFNDTRVIPARLFGHKESGGRIEILVERIIANNHVLALLRCSKPPRPGSILFVSNSRFEVIKREESLYELKCHDTRPITEILERIGEIPLPHYFHRAAEESDKKRYQTVYAKHNGSIAAPTAGLHFDELLLEKIKSYGVQSAFLTLHVGLGTFAPVRVERIADHRMHKEYIEVSEQVCQQIRAARERGGRVIAVGTTSARALETAHRSGVLQPYAGETDIFIYPGFSFQAIDVLITNFHLPSSTLLMLVCALGGHEAVMNAYKEAVTEKYRFFSYGDAMWVEKVEARCK